MKRILLYAVLLFSLNGVAQNPLLFEHTWYLQRLEIDEQIYFYPSQGIISTIDFTEIDDTNVFMIDFPGCFGTQNYLITYVGDTGFSLPGFIAGFDFECPAIPPDIHDRHYYFYWGMTESSDFGPFSYVVSNQNGHDFLAVTNVKGDQAFYADAQLAVADFTSNQLTVFFNPTSDHLEFFGADAKNIKQATILNPVGQVVVPHNRTQEGINLSAVSGGWYVVQLSMQDGRTIAKKFLKY